MRTGDTGVHASPEANLLAVAHYLEALDWQREFIKMHAVLGGKNPHLQSFLVGGHGDAGRSEQSGGAQYRHDRAAQEVHGGRARLRDAGVAARPAGHRSFYKNWAAHGQALATTCASANTPKTTRPSRLFLPQGIIRGRDLSKVEPFDHTRVAEYITHSW